MPRTIRPSARSLLLYVMKPNHGQRSSLPGHHLSHLPHAHPLCVHASGSQPSVYGMMSRSGRDMRGEARGSTAATPEARPSTHDGGDGGTLEALHAARLYRGPAWSIKGHGQAAEALQAQPPLVAPALLRSPPRAGQIHRRCPLKFELGSQSRMPPEAQATSPRV